MSKLREPTVSSAFEKIRAGAPDFHARISKSKSAAKVDFPWYPYDTLANFAHIAPLISEQEDFLFQPPKRIADIGAADGDLAFYLSSLGFSVDVYDYGPTNMNGLRGVRFLQSAYGALKIHEADLDAQWSVGGDYDLIFFLGILYHLKNPFYTMEQLSRHTRHLFVSTRVARFFKNDDDVSAVPAAYLLDPDEANNDSTNYWIFTEAGLKRLFARTGWNIVRYRSIGATRSNPFDNDRDERAFALLESAR